MTITVVVDREVEETCSGFLIKHLMIVSHASNHFVLHRMVLNLVTSGCQVCVRHVIISTRVCQAKSRADRLC